ELVPGNFHLSWENEISVANDAVEVVAGNPEREIQSQMGGGLHQIVRDRTVPGMATGSDRGVARNRVGVDSRLVAAAAAVVETMLAEVGHRVVVDTMLEGPDHNLVDLVEGSKPAQKYQPEAEIQQAEKQLVLDRERQRQPEFG